MYASVKLGVRPLEFKCAGHVAAIRATDAEVPRPLLSISASVARDFRPVNCQRLFLKKHAYIYVLAGSWLSLLDF
jgi:hypothetical protein